VVNADGSSISSDQVSLPLPSDAPQLQTLKSSLKNVLIAYSRYDPSIRFDSSTIGMGLIVAVILYHTQGDEVATFWVLVSLIENYDMR
jgi:hypothetical protein